MLYVLCVSTPSPFCPPLHQEVVVWIQLFRWKSSVYFYFDFISFSLFICSTQFLWWKSPLLQCRLLCQLDAFRMHTRTQLIYNLHSTHQSLHRYIHTLHTHTPLGAHYSGWILLFVVDFYLYSANALMRKVSISLCSATVKLANGQTGCEFFAVWVYANKIVFSMWNMEHGCMAA